MTDQTIDAILKKQLARYHRFREQLAESRDQASPRPAPVITLSTQTGCCPRDLSQLLAARFDCQVWEPELIDVVARDQRLRQEVSAILESEALTRVATTIEALVARHRCRDDDRTVAHARVILILAETGGVVLQGRAAAFVLGKRADLRLRLVANERYRLAMIRRQQDVDAREAGVILRASDKQRAGFVRTHYLADVDDPRAYDLVLNTERLVPEAAAELAERFLELKRR